GGRQPRSVAKPTLTPSARKVKPTGSAASWGMVKGMTSISPTRKPRPAEKCSDFGSSGIAPCWSRTARLQARWAGAVRKTGTFSFVASRCKPATWSECSCVIRIAEISSARSPSARSRLQVSRPDSPASTRIRVALVATSAQFPRLPLASTDTDTPIAVAYPQRLWKREQFFSSRYLWGNGPSVERGIAPSPAASHWRCRRGRAGVDTQAKTRHAASLREPWRLLPRKQIVYYAAPHGSAVRAGNPRQKGEKRFIHLRPLRLLRKKEVRQPLHHRDEHPDDQYPTPRSSRAQNPEQHVGRQHNHRRQQQVAHLDIYPPRQRSQHRRQ